MSKYLLGIDVGGTEVKMGAFDFQGNNLFKWAITTDRSDSGKNIIPDIAASIRKELNDRSIPLKDISYAGMGVPGAVSDGKHVNKCVNLGWDLVDVSGDLGKLLDDMPVVVGNDANTAALGEIWQGAAMGYDSMVLLTIGTDIGGAVIIDGKCVNGAFGGGGEIGHMIINTSETHAHGCGKKGCFGYYASGTGLSIMGTDKLGKEVTAKDVIDLTKAGDETAKEVFEEYCRIFGRGCAIVSCVVEPQVIVLGGGVSKAGEMLSSNIKKYFEEYAFHSALDTEIVCSKLMNDSGIFGGAKMALQELEKGN